MSTPESTNPTNDHVDMAGYVMDMLTPEQKRRADEHLAGCPECRGEIGSLQEWSSALRHVPEEMLLDGPPDDADLVLQRTLRQVRQEAAGSRRHRLAVLTSAAPASVPPGTRTVTTVDTGTGARIDATVTPAVGWVRLSATVGGIPAGQKCLLEVIGRDGREILAGSWLVSPAGEANGTTLNGSALIDPAQVASIRVVNTDGKRLVSVHV